jgi:hypothetical protein
MLTLVGVPNIQRLYTAQQLRQAVPLAQPGTSPLELWPLPTSTVKEDDSYRQPEQSNRKEHSTSRACSENHRSIKKSCREG